MAFDSPVRKDVLNYLRACEYLIAATRTSDDPLFSHEERAILEFYVIEISKILDLIPETKR